MRLFELERVWARAAFEAMFPEDTALPHGIGRLNPERLFDETIAAARFEQAIGLRLALWMIALAPIWLLRRPRTIASLGKEERQHVLDRLLASSVYAVRQLAVAFKAIAALFYVRSPEVRQAMLDDAVLPDRAREVPPPLESGFVAIRTRKRAPAVAPGGTRAA